MRNDYGVRPIRMKKGGKVKEPKVVKDTDNDAMKKGGMVRGGGKAVKGLGKAC